MEYQSVSPQPASNARSVRVVGPTSPRLYLSSTTAGWEGIQAQAYIEPNEFVGWMTPVVPAIYLMLFRGRGMRIEARRANGPWAATQVHDGDLSLRAGWSMPVEVRWRALVDAGTPTRTLHVQLSRELFMRTAANMSGSDPASVSLIERTGFHDPLLAQIGFTLWRELEHPSLASRLYAETSAHLLVVHLLRQYTRGGAMYTEEVEHGRLTPRQVQRVKEFVRAHLCRDLSLDSLAQQTGFSPYHFARLFRRATGESPHQFVLRQRIEEAQRLLEQARMPLAEVAIATGFAHQSHLTRHFKRQFGVTPSAYRRERSLPDLPELPESPMEREHVCDNSA